MYSITPTINNPSITELKSSLENGSIILYDLDGFDVSEFNLVINLITSKGYELKNLSELIIE